MRGTTMQNPISLILTLCVGLSILATNELCASDPFTKVTTGPIVSSGGSTSLAWGDFNNDGFIDLYVNVLTPATSLLYSNNGNGTFTRILTGSVATQVGRCFGAAWGDYDNDGLLDLFAATSN